MRSLLFGVLVVVFAAACTLAVLVSLTGGFVIYPAGVRVSLRSAFNPWLIAAASGAGCWALSSPRGRRQAWAAALERARRIDAFPPAALAPIVLALTVAGVLTVAATRGSFAVGGSDSYGYVSQAGLWLKGSLIVRQPFSRDMPPAAAAALAPLGYRRFPGATAASADIVPVYPPGLPLLMAAFMAAAGPRAAYWVVPLLAGVAVWAVFTMASRIAGALAGMAAALLLATSPAFISEMLWPTSDVPAAALWAVTLAALLSRRWWAMLAAGSAAGLAILIRPNLAPLALVCACLPAAGIAGANAGAALDSWRTRGQRVLIFAAACAPWCIVLLIVNVWLYGSPFATGYGSLEGFYRWAHLRQNVVTYTTELLGTQTPLILAALAAPFVLPATRPASAIRPRAVAILWLAFAAVVMSSYLFYLHFAKPLRFLLPAYPPLLALTTAALFALASRVTRGRGAAAAAAMALVAAACAHGVGAIRVSGALDAWKAEQRYVTAADYVREHLPASAVLISGEHSGSVRHYADRISLRYDLIAPPDLDPIVAALQARGYEPYFLVDQAERETFATRFRAHSRFASLDWLPHALIHADIVRIYDPRDQTGGAGRLRTPDVFR
jgi:hypothetical protein